MRRCHFPLLTWSLIAVFAALAVPLAPVHQDRVTLTWPTENSARPSGTANAAAMPLLPYQPVELDATVPCTQPGPLPDDGESSTTLLSTVPPDPADADTALLNGLRIQRTAGQISVTSDDRQVATTTPPPGPCTLRISSDPDGTSAALNGETIADVGGDVRPMVAGIFTDLPTAATAPGTLRVEVRTDTRFQTSATPLKVGLIAVSALALLAAVLTVARLDSRSEHTRRVPASIRRGRGPRPVDAVVGAGLLVWAIIGPTTVDDGYIASIVRTRDVHGYVGNLHRWLNAPEAPFGWFYELYHLWSQISTTALWMRIPATVLAMVCWLLLSRAVLPRLGSVAARPATVWIAAAAFGAWWLPFNLGLRPEPWVAVALLVTLVAVERALVTSRLLPLVLAVVVVAAAVTITPSGIITLAPMVAGLVPLLRALRRRPDLAGPAVPVLLLAAGSSALLLGFADQTYAAVSEATRIRLLIGGDVPWHQEIERYANLLDPESIEGALPRRVPVLLTLLGLGAIAWWLSARVPVWGLAHGPTARVAATLGLSLVALTVTPTKWTYHFGALAGVGSAVLVVALYLGSRRVLRGREFTARSLAAAATGTAAVALAGGAVLVSVNRWPSVSGYGVTWSTVPPQWAGVDFAPVVLTGGLLLAAVAGAAAAWALAGGSPPPFTRRLPTPGGLALVLVVATVAMTLGSVTLATVERRGSYSLAADSAASLRGSGCGLADSLRVETDPQAGMLPVSDDHTGPAERTGGISEAGGRDGLVPLPGERPAGTAPEPVALEVAGVELPGWVALPQATGTGTGTTVDGDTPWFVLDEPVRRGAVPLVVTVSGSNEPGTSLVAEFGRTTSRGIERVGSRPLPDRPDAPEAGDVRIMVGDLAEADVVRLSVTAAPATASPLAFSVPRSPRTVPMNSVLARGTEAVVEWPVAFFYPCLTIAGTPDGTAALPEWRLGAPASDDSGRIITEADLGGPFATARALVTPQRVPVYLDGDPGRDVATLHRWVPVTTFDLPAPRREPDAVPGWHADGQLQVPGQTE